MRATRNILGIIGLVVLTAGSIGVAAQRGQQRRAPLPISMSGTYDLDTTRGDNVQRAADMATRRVPLAQRDRAYQSLFARLQPPQTLSIDRNGRTVTISSSNGPRASFDADGMSRNERGANGRTTTSRAVFVGDQLSVTSSGFRGTDYLVTFEPLNNGDGLLVTRRMDSDDLARPVTVQSFYRRVNAQPRWDLYPDNGPGPRPGPRAFTMVEGTRIVAILDTSLSTRTQRSGDRFTMTVQAPGEYQDARIDGVIARVNPYSQGHNADMRVDFDTIRLRNGQTAEFDAVLSSVRTPGGVIYRIDAGGGVDTTRTDTTVEHGAIGAALGAIIGAIAGGGKGAVVGAVVGGAGGAILAQDRDQYLDLPPGTQVTLIVTAPRYRTP